LIEIEASIVFHLLPLETLPIPRFSVSQIVHSGIED